MIQPTSRSSISPTTPQNYGPALAIITTVFFMWGFVTVLNDVLVAHFRQIFDLTFTETMLIQFTFFSAYFILSFPASRIISRLGYQKSIVVGLAVMGVGALLFVPAAIVASYPLFLTALYVLASGMTLLQVAANPYVAELGAPEKASSRLNLAQAINSVGTTIAPYLGGLLIFSTTVSTVVSQHLSPAELQAHRVLEASTVRLPYIGIAVLLFVLALIISQLHLPVLSQIDEASALDRASPEHLASSRSIWSYRHLVLGAVGIFVYVGAEVSIGSFLINYFSLPEIGNLTRQTAAGYVSLYWGGAMVGRFVGSWLMQKVKPGLVLGCAAIGAGALLLVSILTTGHIAMWSVILVGFFNSVMFPTIFTLGIDGLGKMTGKGSGLLIAAIVGGAIIPLAQGALADRVGLQHAFLLPLLAYLYILYYGFRGSQHAYAQTD